MPSSSILFSPELDERELDKEVGQIDDRLDSVGEDVPVNFDAEDMDGLSPAGMGGGGGGGVGGAAGAGAIASKLPGTVSGVVSSAAMPIALAGGVGLGMLAAMQGASARLQTSVSLLGQAWNNIWRPLGDNLDDLLVRDAVEDIVEATKPFGDVVESDGVIVGLSYLGDKAKSGFTDAMTNAFTGGGININLEDAIDIGAVLGISPAAIGITLAENAIISVDNWLQKNLPDFESVSASALLGAIPFPVIGAGLLLKELDIPSFPDNFWPDKPKLPENFLPDPLSWAPDTLPDPLSWAPDTLPDPLSWAPDTLPDPLSWAPNTLPDPLSWAPDTLPDPLSWAPDTLPDPLSFPSNFWPELSVQDVIQGLRDGDGGGNGGTDDATGDDGRPPRDLDRGSPEDDSPTESPNTGYTGPAEGLATGGRVTQTGLAEVHRGELVSDPDRLVSELASAVSQSTGGQQRASMDTSSIERKLDDLNRNLKRAMNRDVVVQVGEEEIARATSNGKRHRVADTDPTV